MIGKKNSSHWSSSQYSNYNAAINYFVTVPKYRIQAQEIARKDGLLGGGESSKKTRGKKISKQEEEAILKQIIEQKLDIKGGYRKPSKSIRPLTLLLIVHSRCHTRSLVANVSLSLLHILEITMANSLVFQILYQQTWIRRWWEDLFDVSIFENQSWTIWFHVGERSRWNVGTWSLD